MTAFKDDAIFGLIGKSLKHSFSQTYFTKKFADLGLGNHVYKLFELAQINDISNIFQLKNLKGLNVTIPYKVEILPFLDEIDEKAREIGAVNTIKIFPDGRKKGYNTDYYGFEATLNKFNFLKIKNALIIGNGGAAKAVASVLKDKAINFVFAERELLNGTLENNLTLESIIETSDLIINTTPLGMYPQIQTFPNLPYYRINEKKCVIDLVYNPEKTAFLEKCQTPHQINGSLMLYAQAEKAWEIWKKLI